MRKQPFQISYYSLGMMLLGSFLLAFTYYHINFQNQLSEGGFVGLALLGKYMFNLPPSLTVLLLDLLIFVIALFFKGTKFMMNTLITSVSFSVFYELCDRWSPLQIDFGNNLFMAAVTAGVLTGIGAGIVLRAGGATGGDDILCVLLSQWTGMRIGTAFILADVVVLSISLLYLPLKSTLFTVLAVCIGGQIITWIVNARKKPATKATVKVPVSSYGMQKKTA